MSRFTCLVLALSIATPSLTLAQETTTTEAAPPTHSDQEARAIFDAGEIAYADGRYEAALADFVQAHDLSGRPELLYNIALAAERLRHDQQALDAYVAFLAARPEATMRSAIESRIEILRTAISEHTTPPPPAEESTPTPAPTSPPPASSSGGIDTGALVLTIAGGAVLVGGIVFLALGLSDASHVSGATYPAHWSDYHSAYDDAPLFSVIGGVAAGVGAAALIAGIVWLAVGSGGSSETQVAFGPGSVSLRGTF